MKPEESNGVVSESAGGEASAAGTGMAGRPELLAPAGNWECVRAAVANGADAIYFGLPRFNARLRADNFTEQDLPELMRFLHSHGVRGFVAFNTLVFTGELADAAAYLERLAEAGVDAVIVQDIGLARMVRALAPSIELHASTQMTITSPEGLALLERTIGLDRAVLARELSIRELRKFGASGDASGAALSGLPPLEVFVHGALCVAYSGQCLTSEALGQRSANRGECAQACRLPYDLVVDGKPFDLGGRRHLLSPQDLAAVDLIPELTDAGIASFKIEGRLKSPEYVAAVTKVYRKAIDSALAGRPSPASPRDRYLLEMTFSRGLSTGWLEGTDHPRLTHGRFGKKRGPFIGTVARSGRDWVEADAFSVPVQEGDGIVFDTGGDTEKEQGGRVFAVTGRRIVLDRRSGVQTSRVPAGARIWKTSDPSLERELQRTWKGKLEPEREPIALEITGCAGTPLQVRVVSDEGIAVESAMPLERATNRPITGETLDSHLGRLGTSRYRLGRLTSALEGDVILPLAELNRLRREIVRRLDALREPAASGEDSSPPEEAVRDRVSLGRMLECIASRKAESAPRPAPEGAGPDAQTPSAPRLSVLCRTIDQAEAALSADVECIYLDFEDIRRYRDAVARLRELAADKKQAGGAAAVPAPAIILATPRIQKAGEEGFFRLIERAEPDGVLVRNLGAVDWFAASPGEHPFPAIGDFTLNIANPLSAEYFIDAGLQRVTISCDLTADQALDLLGSAPAEWFELVLHQHMPMFHMEHCVFCTFLSNGHDFTDCGRPCETRVVQLRDRVGQLHTLQADVGCRNTLFRGQAQTGARYFERFQHAGLRHFRIELLRESATEAKKVLRTYAQLLQGSVDGSTLWKKLKADSRLGVVEGTLRED